MEPRPGTSLATSQPVGKGGVLCTDGEAAVLRQLWGQLELLGVGGEVHRMTRLELKFKLAGRANVCIYNLNVYNLKLNKILH